MQKRIVGWVSEKQVVRSFDGQLSIENKKTEIIDQIGSRDFELVDLGFVGTSRIVDICKSWQIWIIVWE